MGLKRYIDERDTKIEEAKRRWSDPEWLHEMCEAEVQEIFASYQKWIDRCHQWIRESKCSHVWEAVPGKYGYHRGEQDIKCTKCGAYEAGS
jgi:hypothetical protein